MVPFLWRRGWSRSFGGAARSVSPVGRNIKNGVVRSTSDNRWLEPTTPSAPAKEASRHFLNGRSHPSLSKEGTSAFPSVVFNAPVSSKRCDMASLRKEGRHDPRSAQSKLHPLNFAIHKELRFGQPLNLL